MTFVSEEAPQTMILNQQEKNEQKPLNVVCTQVALIL